MARLDKLLKLNTEAVNLVKLGKFERALKIYLSLNLEYPNNPYILKNIANTYRNLNNLESAIKYYNLSLQNNSDPQTLSDLGYAYFIQGNLEASNSTFDKCLNIDSNLISAIYGKAHIFFLNKDYKNAAIYYKNVFDQNPSYEQTATNLYISRRRMCDWTDLDKISKTIEEIHIETPWASVVRTENEKANLIAGKIRSDFYRRMANLSPITTTSHSKKIKNKIRVGYVSGNFGNHAVSYTMASIFEYHDTEKFEVIAYSYGKDDKSKIRESIKKHVAKFEEISLLSPREIASKIYNDQVDILVDLTGYTDGTKSELFAYKPCNIQITWAGLSASTGSDFFNYMFVDDVIVPTKSKKYYSEKLVYLKPCFCPYKHLPTPENIDLKRSDFGLPKNKIVFGVFNQMYKIDQRTWKSWINILKKVPNSILWLIDQSPDGKQNLIKYAKKYGVDKSRLVFVSPMPTEMFYARMKLADIALDTMGYGGGTTTYLTLSNGVPIVTLLGNHPASRFSSSILYAANVPELVVKNTREYEKIAIKLATEKKYLNSVKSKLTIEVLNNNIFDTFSKTKEIEEAYFKLLNKINS